MPCPHIERLRLFGLVEGTSLLLLLFVAVPLKYGADWPEAVRWVGWIHGILFLVFLVDLAWVHFRFRWPVLRSLMVFVAALLPFGPFVINGRMKSYAQEYERGQS